jgi:ferredoxin
MAVIITDTCISCDACLDECDVNEAIVDNDENPTGEDIYYVDPEKCDECASAGVIPKCAEACPTEGCIVWGENPTTDGAVAGEPCVAE